MVSTAAAVRPARGLAVDSTAAAAAGAAAPPPLQPRPTTANCSELFFEQRVDQFDFNSDAPTWRQRYFLCPQFADRGGSAPPPILFLGERWLLPPAAAGLAQNVCDRNGTTAYLNGHGLSVSACQ